MQDEEVQEKLYSILKKLFNTNIEITNATTANDINSWDSLNHIILIKKIEDEFNMEFDLFDMIELKTVGDMVNYIKSRVA
jgi:acyl carrier protein